MNDVANRSQPSDTDSSKPPIDLTIYRDIHAKMRPAPSHAFGFLLGLQIRRRRARWLYDFGDKLSTMTPEEAEEELEDFQLTTDSMLPSLLYCAFPNLPRLRLRILPIVDVELVPKHYVFVLRDNATREGLTARLDPEVIAGVREKLGLGDQEPNWYRIDAYIRLLLLIRDGGSSQRIPVAPSDRSWSCISSAHVYFCSLAILNLRSSGRRSGIL
ncbi:hypothetical protein C8T65DRAFT_247498 [Cerioporus squamosus]|nr:hypothetical protein C8T65DRAFT_247498 [Cerioporus squamosus]